MVHVAQCGYGTSRFILLLFPAGKWTLCTQSMVQRPFEAPGSVREERSSVVSARALSVTSCCCARHWDAERQSNRNAVASYMGLTLRMRQWLVSTRKAGVLSAGAWIRHTQLTFSPLGTCDLPRLKVCVKTDARPSRANTAVPTSTRGDPTPPKSYLPRRQLAEVPAEVRCVATFVSVPSQACCRTPITWPH